MSWSRKKSAAALSVLSNTTLVVMKLVIGLFSGSVSILSEAIHSGNDLIASLIAFFSIRIAERPPDAEHPYGHGKAEGISGAIEAGLIVVAALWIIAESVRKLFTGGEITMLGWGTGVMAFSAALNFFVSRYLHRVAKEEDSIALAADAHHLSTDVLTSLGVTFGLVLVWVTGWTIIDPIVAIIVGLFIARIGVRLTIQATNHLMDRGLPVHEVRLIEAVVRSEPRVNSYHDLRTRKSGSERHVDLHIVLRANATLLEAHEIADELEKRIASQFSSANVVIHTDPYDDSVPARAQ